MDRFPPLTQKDINLSFFSYFRYYLGKYIINSNKRKTFICFNYNIIHHTVIKSFHYMFKINLDIKLAYFYRNYEV